MHGQSDRDGGCRAALKQPLSRASGSRRCNLHRKSWFRLRRDAIRYLRVVVSVSTGVVKVFSGDFVAQADYPGIVEQNS